MERMVTNFKFSPTGEKVFWNCAGVAYASMHKSGGAASLNLKVQALDVEHYT